MKNIYLFVLLLAQISLGAQIVNIPDPYFKAKLLSASPANQIAQGTGSAYVSIDTNNDGEIQVSEAEAITTISLYVSNGPNGIQFPIQSIEGIKSFINLKYLTVSDCPNLSSVDVSGMSKLRLVSFDNNTSMSSANFSNCDLLNNISVRNANIVHLDISNLPSLGNVNSSGGKIQTFNFSGSTGIHTFLCSNNHINTIDLSSLVNLTTLHIYENPLTSLNLNNLTKLQTLNTDGCQLTSLSLQNTPKLKYIEAMNNNLSTIDLSQSPVLGTLYLSGNQFTSIDLSHSPQLVTLGMGNNHLTTIDISHNPLLSTPGLSYNNLQTMFIKNGLVGGGGLYDNNPNLSYICCDEGEINSILNANALFGYNNVVVNSYCSFTPGGTVYNVNGNTKYDVDNNGCDPTDINKAFQKFTITGIGTSGSLISDHSGNYSIPINSGPHTITPVVDNPAYFTISPASIAVNFPLQTSPMTQNFCMSANGTHPDLEVVIVPVRAAVPGFDTGYKIVFKNKGTTTQSGTLTFDFDDSLMNFLNATVTPNSQSTGNLTWNFANLLPFETREIKAVFTLNTPTQTPPLNGGDILHYTAQINGAPDDTPADNLFTLNQVVVNAFDPNDKTCLEGPSINQAKVGDYVHYLIRFENTGTANAQNIVVKDIIDASKFDLSSLVPLTGSHTFVTRISNPNTVEFIFENIQLPFDDMHNDGYVSFKIKTKSTLTPGDSFSNTANIYFDYNHPIITNTYTTAIQTENNLATKETKNNTGTVRVYPNPVKEVLNVQSKDEVIKAEIYDLSGRILTSMGAHGNSMNVSSLPKGNYIIKIFTKGQTTVQKFIKD
ncbi:T9SS type A sorting domain-containing protein [Chryseobacterium sp.]|uniref:DUF7619 domain-containing protein n=1 Tax=Chryseobacterium sp. TaxID=1871047 RepID=UPI0025C1E7AA|nr:T9SS type A sorting domain-containing protein [Chryseobacterium sp.]MBV8325788.1 T9SS type A sorting domain-containing protein [Chryseobacterium sp.]